MDGLNSSLDTLVKSKSKLGLLIAATQVLGWLMIISGVVVLYQLIATISQDGFTIENFFELTTIPFGIFYIITAKGLSRKKRWAWYLGFPVFICSTIVYAISYSFVSIIIFFNLIFLIMSKKEIFESIPEDSK